MWRTSNLILEPITRSSLKLKKSEWYSCRSFEVKHEWGMHSGVVVLKLKSNKSELSKKKCSFLDYFFLSILEAGASAFLAVRLGSIS